MEDRLFLRINKYALAYLKNILPEYNVECAICGAGEYNIDKIYPLLMSAEDATNDAVNMEGELSSSDLMDEIMHAIHTFIFEMKDPDKISDEEWIDYFEHGFPEEFLQKDGDIFYSGIDSILIKLCKNVYFYSDETCRCLNALGHKEQANNKPPP